MNKRLFLATTAAVAIATSAFAQSSPNTSTSNSPTAQRPQDSNSTTTPSSSPTTPSSNSSGQASNPSTNSAQTQQPSSTNQNTANQPSNSGTGPNTTQAPTSGNSTNQAQTSQPSNQTAPSNQAQTNSPSTGQTQSANPPASTSNQAQSPTGSSTNTAQQPNNQQNTADRSSNTNVNASVNINDQQRTRISTSISHLNVQPLNNVNFSLSVGTVVPRDVRLQPLPAEVVEIVPQYRGYNFVLVKDEIVIVEPSSYNIVAVMPYSGRSTAAAPARSEQRKVTFSDRDREVIRKHAKARPVERERQTTGSTVRTEIRRGERVPDGMEIDAFPDEVYREAPSLREYRYIHRDSRTYIVEPQERRVIEEID
jgi:hypothetical protein